MDYNLKKKKIEILYFVVNIYVHFILLYFIAG